MGEVTVIVPVDIRQVGWIVVATGAEGATGAVLIVTSVPGDTQPLKFITLTVYVPGNTALNIGLDW
jgi:hypothetical protein